MKIRMTRTIFHGHDVLDEGSVVLVDNPEWWIEMGFAEPVKPEPYEIKPHVAVPMSAGGAEKPASASPPVPRSRGRKSKRFEDSGQS
jgi:hypothetical protein